MSSPGSLGRGEAPSGPLPPPPRPRVSLEPGKVQEGIVRLAMGIVVALRDALEEQALHRFEAQSLAPEEEERLGTALAELHRGVQEVLARFDLTEEDVQLNLGLAECDA